MHTVHCYHRKLMYKPGSPSLFRWSQFLVFNHAKIHLALEIRQDQVYEVWEAPPAFIQWQFTVTPVMSSSHEAHAHLKYYFLRLSCH